MRSSFLPSKPFSPVTLYATCASLRLFAGKLERLSPLFHPGALEAFGHEPSSSLLFPSHAYQQNLLPIPLRVPPLKHALHEFHLMSPSVSCGARAPSSIL